jgi:hypothetical protein
MEFLGVICKKAGGPALTYDRWCELAQSRTELVPSDALMGRNPATGESFSIRPRRPNSMAVVIEEEEVGRMNWSESDEDQVTVIGEPAFMIPLARELAASLDAEFQEMPMLADFVVASRDDAQRVCDSTCPSRDFSGLDAKGIDTVKLGTLHAMLAGEDFDPSFMNESSLCSGGDDGPWVFEVPEDLVQRLSRLDANETASVAAEWANTEEFERDNWSPDSVRRVLEGFSGLCRRAEAQGKPVLMWISM